MKKNLLAILSCILLSIFLLTACGKDTVTKVSPSATPNQQDSTIPQQPHSEATFEDMMNFLNTVNVNTFENSNFKDIINRVKAEGYLIRPYYDGQPAGIQENTNQVRLSPQNDNIGYPSNFTYFCKNDEYLYTIRVFYIKEELLSIAKKDGIGGLYNYQMGIQKNEENAPSSEKHKTNINKTDGYINIFISRTGDTSHAEFMWDDKYLIQINGNVEENGNAHETINLEILNHLSFEKMPLNSSAATTPAESPTPQPSDSLQTPSSVPEE